MFDFMYQQSAPKPVDPESIPRSGRVQIEWMPDAGRADGAYYIIASTKSFRPDIWMAPLRDQLIGSPYRAGTAFRADPKTIRSVKHG